MQNLDKSNTLAAVNAVAIGTSVPMRELERALARLAAADVNVLLHGEIGTGKRVLAEAMHVAGPRAAAPFFTVAVAGRTETQIERELFGDGSDGLLAQASGATLYLEEITALPLRLQRRFVRALAAGDERSATRVIATTTIELEEPLRLGRLIPELYFQIGLVRLTLPPLRERREDLAVLAEHFVRNWCERLCVRPPVISRAALAQLAGHTWPGNIRELQQTLEDALTVGRSAELTVERIRHVLGRRSPRRALLDVFPLRAFERDYIAAVLVRCGWNRSLAARHLGIGRNTLMRKIRSFKLERCEAAA